LIAVELRPFSDIVLSTALETALVTGKGFTHPTATRKENIKMLGHSIFWGSIVSTIMGTAASIGISHLSKEKPADPPKSQAPKVIERVLVEPPQPKTFILHDPKGKTYTLNVDPSPASKPHRPPHHHHHRKVAGHRPKNP